MKLQRVNAFLKTVPRYHPNGDETQVTVKCPFCGDSTKSDHGHFSIKVDVNSGEPMWYKCFRADCEVKGVLTTRVLDMLGCKDPDTLIELDNYNKTINVNTDRDFVEKRGRSYQIVNVIRSDNQSKLEYLNQRLGIKFTPDVLRHFKIQLSLYSFLDINYIHSLPFSQHRCDLLDEYAICFLSMYEDYMICRDITKKLLTGYRYTIYRTAGKPRPNDMKLYSIPTELDLLDPNPAEINVAEGTFSVIGAYLHCDGIGHSARNSIWLANCGSEYEKTILHVVKQYGLVDVIIHIWSDSEIGIEKYEKLYNRIHKRMNILGMYIHYNTKKEDFGYAAEDIKIRTVQIDS